MLKICYKKYLYFKERKIIKFETASRLKEFPRFILFANPQLNNSSVALSFQRSNIYYIIK